jgi:hypothetical protein
VNWKSIDRDDELPLTAAQRGHLYGETDIIVGEFLADPDDSSTAFQRTVQFLRSCGGGSGYYDSTGDAVDARAELVRWRYANDVELDAYDAEVEAGLQNILETGATGQRCA